MRLYYVQASLSEKITFMPVFFQPVNLVGRAVSGEYAGSYQLIQFQHVEYVLTISCIPR
jgi:hypothetical protein